MIKTKTLFILGAGASAPFNYPTNAELRENIRSTDCNSMTINALNINNENNFDGSFIPKHFDLFKEEFSKSTVSIDAFL